MDKFLPVNIAAAVLLVILIILIFVFNKMKDAGVFVFYDVKYTHVEKVLFVLLSFYNMDNFCFSFNNLWFAPDGEMY